MRNEQYIIGILMIRQTIYKVEQKKQCRYEIFNNNIQSKLWWKKNYIILGMPDPLQKNMDLVNLFGGQEKKLTVTFSEKLSAWTGRIS